MILYHPCKLSTKPQFAELSQELGDLLCLIADALVWWNLWAEFRLWWTLREDWRRLRASKKHVAIPFTLHPIEQLNVDLADSRMLPCTVAFVTARMQE